MPLSGSSKFVRTQVGDMSFDEVNYVEFHADTWDFGYTLWLDGVQFEDCTPTSIVNIEGWKEASSKLFPNPVEGIASLIFENDFYQDVKILVYDLKGREQICFEQKNLATGTQQINIDLSSLAAGVYTYRIISGSIVDQRSFIKN